MDNSFLVAPEDAVRVLGSSVSNGLSAKQVLEHRKRYGLNELPHDPSTPLWKLILEQFKDHLVIILLLAAFVSFVLAVIEVYSAANVDADAATTFAAFVEPLVILLILIGNAAVGVIQESNAEKAIEALKDYTPDEANVLRCGRLERIAACDLVPGDILDLAVGDKIPADARVLKVSSSSFRVDQALLTGESASVFKDAAAIGTPNDRPQDFVKQDMTNMLFSGTTITIGRARAIVVAIGSATAIGHIHHAIVSTDSERSPLKKKLDEFGDSLARMITIVCILVWVINIRHFGDANHHGWLRGAIYYFKIAVALAVAAIPEGLAVVITTCLALGTKRMARNNAIVRTLPSVETLGCTSVICSDKTGTLTTNMMTVRELVFVGPSSQNSSAPELEIYNVEGNSYSPIGKIKIRANVAGTSAGAEKTDANESQTLALLSPAIRMASEICSLCNDASVQYHVDTGLHACIGEPTEAALHVLVEKIGTPSESVNSQIAMLAPLDRVNAVNTWYEEGTKRLATFEFSRDRKSMSVVVAPKARGGSENAQTDLLVAQDLKKECLLVKGAPELLLLRCTHIMLADGTRVPTSHGNGKIKAAFEKHYEALATKYAYRVLGLAMCDLDDGQKRTDWRSISDAADYVGVEQNLTFVGLAAMQDPPRPEVMKAIRQCESAGIRVIVVTGDNQATAEAICRDIGVLGSEYNSLGKEKAKQASSANGPETSWISITGKQWEGLGPHERRVAAQHARLFSRVEPVHKQELVEVLQALGHVVAMTGDGVNDAPALRRADIGVAMGSGTDVAKLAADMVLADDNFASIVAAVREGRSIYDNTKQFIRYLISSNIGEVVAIFLTVLLGMPEALIPVQLLWVNLVTDGLPATALGFNPPDREIMRRRPRHSTEAIVTRWLFVRYLVVGAYVGAATVGGYAWWYMMYAGGPQISWGHLTSHARCGEWAQASNGTMTQAEACAVFRGTSPRHATTVSLSVLVVIEMLNAMNSLSENSSLLVMPVWRNVYLLMAIALSFALHMLILYLPPLASVFGIVPLNTGEWTGVILLSLPVLLIDEVLKFASRQYLAAQRNSGGQGVVDIAGGKMDAAKRTQGVMEGGKTRKNK